MAISRFQIPTAFDHSCRVDLEWHEPDLSLALTALLLLIGVSCRPGPNSSGWGYYPSDGMGLAVPILVILLLMGRP